MLNDVFEKEKQRAGNMPCCQRRFIMTRLVLAFHRQFFRQYLLLKYCLKNGYDCLKRKEYCECYEIYVIFSRKGLIFLVQYIFSLFLILRDTFRQIES